MRSFCRLLSVTVIACSFSIALSAAGKDPETEANIRKLIADIDVNGGRDHSLPDFIFWSGAYREPVIGGEDDKVKQLDGKLSISDRDTGSEKLVTTPQRIIVADSKDLAYEYSIFTLKFDTKAGQHVRLEGAGLRIWQKQNGEWKQAAIFARRYDK